MEYKLDTKKPSLVCLILLISFPSVVAVLISPALPSIGVALQVSKSAAQQLVTVFVVGYAFGQLLYSPIANRFGRKVTIYIGIVLYLVSCIMALCGIHFHLFQLILWSRLLMALGSGVGMIISFTIINDFYHPEQSRPIVSYTVLAYAFMPAVAIAVGGFITTHFDWKDCFYFYLFYGVFILFISLLLPETLMEKQYHALKLKALLNSYWRAIKHVRLLLFSLIYGLMASYIYVIASAAPFVGIKHIGLTASHYSILLLLPYCGQLFGALFAGKFSKRFSGYQILLMGYGILFAGIAMMFLAFWFHWVTSLTLFVPLFFVMFGLPMVYSTVTVMALAKYEDKATGSAIMTFITMFIAMLGTLALTCFKTNSVMEMPYIFIGVMVVAVIAYLIAKMAYEDMGKSL